MKYTRYNLKSSNIVSFALWIIIVCIIGSLLGVSAYNIIVHSGLFNKSQSDNYSNDMTGETNIELSVFQCGVYSSKENAEKFLLSVGQEYTPFIVEEDGKYKVMIGMFNSNDESDVEKKLANSNINCYCIRYSIGTKSEEDVIVSKIISGYMEIINEFNTNAEVSAIDTNKYKEWCRKVFGENNIKNENLQDLSNIIEKIPEKCTKDDMKKNLVEMYCVISKYRKN